MENAITNRGNWYRLKEVMKRASIGRPLTIGFIGGSITQGSLSSKPTTCYAYHVFTWWNKTFPNTEFTYVNAGIGATDSQFGVARVEKDLLIKKPDFVIIEFSVNDESNEHFLETYEGLVRKVYASDSKPAVLLVHNVFYNTGANAQLQHGKVGRHYHIPCLSMQSSIYPELLAGKILNREITPDDLHPNDAGHELVASVITYFLDKVNKEKMNNEEKLEQLVAPITANGYQNSTRYQNNNIKWKGQGFEKDKEEQRDLTDCFKHGWIASKEGDSIIMEIEGTSIAVQYRKSVVGPAPIAKVIIDGDEEHASILDANFDETWGDKLELQTIMEHGIDGKHTVEVKVTKVQPDNVVPFYLVAVIGAR